MVLCLIRPKSHTEGVESVLSPSFYYFNFELFSPFAPHYIYLCRILSIYNLYLQQGSKKSQSSASADRPVCCQSIKKALKYANGKRKSKDSTGLVVDADHHPTSKDEENMKLGKDIEES